MADIQQSLRILQVSHGDQGGGAQNVAWNLFLTYRARGHRSWLAVGHKLSDDPDVLLVPNPACRSRWARAWLAFGTLLEPLVGRVCGMGLLNRLLRNLTDFISEPRRWLDQYRGYEDFHFPGTWRLLELIPQLPDIVHGHNLHGSYFDLRALPWLSHQVPVILSLHDAWLLSGHCAHSFDCERWKIGCGQCPDLTIYPAIQRDATAYNWQRKQGIYAKSRLYIITPSQWLMDKVQQSMLKGVKYKVIPNAIDLSVFRPGDRVSARANLGLPLESKIVLFAANFARSNPWKDYDTMETAVRQVANANQDMELLFVCLGEEAEEKTLGRAHVHFVGFERDQKRLAMYYQAADVYIHAARAETFPSTIIEALACGVPVVATEVGGIPEQIQDGITGFLTPPADAAAMAARIDQLLKDDALSHEMGQQAATDARRRFDLNRQTNDFLDWYQEVITDWQDWQKNTIRHVKSMGGNRC
jgi:glycosyltransferase involved in cell wall biosynthesis